jgi:hypothetical protein
MGGLGKFNPPILSSRIITEWQVTETEAPEKKRGGSWLLWWQVGEDELNKHAAEYQTMPFWKSARAGAIVCLAISIVITTTAVYFDAGGFSPSAFVDAALMGALALFIGFGQRWALIGAMVYWTLAKIYTGVMAIQSGISVGAVTSVIWWALYMHAFYFAFRVEQRRRKPVLDPNVFS